MSLPRLASIDRFRGFAIVSMVAVNFLADVRSVPPWLKHAPGDGLTFADLVAPFFIFAIALTFRRSALRRESEEGRGRTILHFTRRFLIFIGLGAIIAAGEELLADGSGRFVWGVLQAIGCSGLVALLLIFRPWWVRLSAGIGLLGAYQVLLEFFWQDIVMRSSHGGLPGVLGWASMLLIASSVADLYYRREQSAGLRHVLVAVGSSAVVFFLFDLMSAPLVKWKGPLILWGQNPLMLYLCHYLLLALVVLPGVPALHESAAPALFLAELFIILSSLTALAYFLDRRRVVVSI